MLLFLSHASVASAEEYSDDWTLPRSYVFTSDGLMFAVQFGAREAYAVGFAEGKTRSHLKVTAFTLTGSQIKDQLENHALHLAIDDEEILEDENYTFTVKGIAARGNYHFNNTNIITVEMDNTVEYISPNAFTNCKKLEQVKLSNSLRYLSGFSGCSRLSYVYIPTTVTTIGKTAFYNCSGLNFINIPNSVTAIGPSAFYNCTGLNYASLGSSLTTIGNGAFMYCTGLTYVNIPNSVTSIDERAFYGCSNVGTVTFGSALETIGNRAFMYCNALKTITFGSAVTTIDDRAFYGCSNLKKVWSTITEPNEFGESVFQSYNSETKTYDFTTATLYVPYGSKANYEETEGWKLFDKKIMEYDLVTTAIGDAPRLNNHNVTIKSRRDEAYDLAGRKVTTQAPACPNGALSSGKKGIVISNGRKVAR